MLPPAVDEHELREQPGEHRIESGPEAPHRRAERARPRGSKGDLHARRSPLGYEQQRLAVAALQTFDDCTRRVGAVDDDCLQRVAQRGGHCDLATFVDLEQVDERAKHPVELRDLVATRGRVSVFECQREHLRARSPARRIAIGPTMRRVRLAQRVLGRA